MAESASEYHHGEMDVRAQQDTFVGFIKMTKWGSLAIAVSVLFLTLLFCTQTGFLGSGLAAVVLLVLGVAVLREKPSAHH